MCYCVTSILLQEIRYYMEQLCVNSNKPDILNLLATHYIPYGSSMSQLSDDMIHIQLC